MKIRRRRYKSSLCVLFQITTSIFVMQGKDSTIFVSANTLEPKPTWKVFTENASFRLVSKFKAVIHIFISNLSSRFAWHGRLHPE